MKTVSRNIQPMNQASRNPVKNAHPSAQASGWKEVALRGPEGLRGRFRAGLAASRLRGAAGPAGTLSISRRGRVNPLEPPDPPNSENL